MLLNILYIKIALCYVTQLSSLRLPSLSSLIKGIVNSNMWPLVKVKLFVIQAVRQSILTVNTGGPISKENLDISFLETIFSEHPVEELNVT